MQYYQLLMYCFVIPLQRHVQAADALTRGLKEKRRYRWYGVWDIWRRILFVAANLFISVTTRNVVLVCECMHMDVFAKLLVLKMMCRKLPI